MTSQTATARDVLKAYELGLNTHRFDAVADLIASDAAVWFSDGNHRGIGAIEAAFEKTWQILNNDTYWLDEVEWRGESETVAACIYRFNWKSEVDGRVVGGFGRGTTVLRCICRPLANRPRASEPKPRLSYGFKQLLVAALAPSAVDRARAGYRRRGI